MTIGELLEVLLEPDDTPDASDEALRRSERSCRRAIRDIRRLIRAKHAVDREDVLDFYDDLLVAMSELALAFDLETD